MQGGKWKKLAWKCRVNLEITATLLGWFFSDRKKAKKQGKHTWHQPWCGPHLTHAHNHVMAAMDGCLDAQVLQRKISCLIENQHRHLLIRSNKEIALHQAIRFFPNFYNNKKIPNTTYHHFEKRDRSTYHHFEKRDRCWVAFGCRTYNRNHGLTFLHMSAGPLWKGKYLFWHSNQ